MVNVVISLFLKQAEINMYMLIQFTVIECTCRNIINSVIIIMIFVPMISLLTQPSYFDTHAFNYSV